MLAAPNMIMVGALRRNAGKTGFACAVISALRARGLAVVGAKVTTMRPEDGSFHLDVPGREELLAGRKKYFLIEEERAGGTASNDTAKMLQAGAQRSFWLIAPAAHLDEAAQALLAKAETADAMVCESNSLRLVVEPRRFVLVDREDRAGPASGKPSALDVRRFPHEVVSLDGDPERMRKAAAALAGLF